MCDPSALDSPRHTEAGFRSYMTEVRPVITDRYHMLSGRFDRTGCGQPPGSSRVLRLRDDIPAIVEHSNAV